MCPRNIMHHMLTFVIRHKLGNCAIDWFPLKLLPATHFMPSSTCNISIFLPSTSSSVVQVDVVLVIVKWVEFKKTALQWQVFVTPLLHFHSCTNLYIYLTIVGFHWQKSEFCLSFFPVLSLSQFQLVVIIHLTPMKNHLIFFSCGSLRIFIVVDKMDLW